MNQTANWRTFPQFEKSFSVEPPQVIKRIETTCRLLDAQIHSGSSEQQTRARTALAGYVRLLELVRLIREQRAT